MTTTGREGRCGEDSGTVVEGVVLGVDTHLDLHVTVALNRPG